MKFELRITFSGLCLWVPEATRMHVLMPKTDQHGGHGGHAGHVEKHVTVLEVGLPYVKKLPAGFSRFDLHGRYLDLSDLAGHFDPRLSPEVVNISEIAPGARVKLDQADELVESRAIMSAGRERDRKGFARWKFPKKEGEYYIAHWVQWAADVEVRGDAYVLRAGRLGRPSEPIATLTPDARGVDLLVRHIPESELDTLFPPEFPGERFRMEHFAAYFPLFDDPSLDAIPELSRDGWPEQIGRGTGRGDSYSCGGGSGIPR